MPQLSTAIKENKTNNEAAVRELIDRFRKAFRAKDVNELCLSLPRKLFRSYPSPAASGEEAFRSHWQEFFGSYQSPIHVEFPDVSITAGDDLAFSHCLHRAKGTLKNGQQTDWWLRSTAMCSQRGGQPAEA